MRTMPACYLHSFINQLNQIIMETTNTNWAELLKDKSIIVRHEDVALFRDFLGSCGLVPFCGADLGENGRVIYF